MTSLGNIQTQQLSQQLGLSQQLQQAIGLLQLSHLELCTTLQQAMLSNPILEERELMEESTASLSSLPNDEGLYGSNDATAMLSTSPSLTTQLLAQSQQIPLPDHLRPLVALLLDAINDDGYLPEHIVSTLAEETGASVQDCTAALQHVQQLQPCGIAARSLTECLLLQCQEFYPQYPLMQQILTANPRYLLKHDQAGLARHLHCSLEAIETNLARIRRLQAFPGRILAPQAPMPATCDLMVEQMGASWHIVLNEIGLPQLQLNPMLQSWQGGNKQDQRYLRSKTQEATWLLRSLAIRQRTLRQVGESLVKLQPNFFQLGPTALRPLTLRQVADDLELHESTISRITQHKAISTPYGVFPLKYFFSSKAGRDGDGNDVAAASIRARLTELIANESRRQPLSDLHLANALQHDGIVVARRTVAKYREMLGIAKASERRRLM